VAARASSVGLWHSGTIQLRVVHALFLREVITRFGRHNIGALWLIAEPMMFTLGVAALWSLAGAHRSAGFSIIEFAVLGYSSVLLWRNCASRCSHAIEPNLSLLYHRNVRIVDILLARCLLEIAGATASLLILSVVFASVGWMSWPSNLLQVVTGWLLLAWFGVALGSFIGVLTGLSEIAERVWHPMSYLLFPLSGAVFMVEWLPPAGREVALLLPMVSFLEYIRGGWFGPGAVVHHELPYAMVCTLVLSVLALALARIVARRVQPQ
jgi:capsular polysaccharide transport system permease protein